MSIEKILTGMNIPGTIVHINGTVNVYHFSSALRRIRGVEDDASYEELAQSKTTRRMLGSNSVIADSCLSPENSRMLWRSTPLASEMS
jgi:hypothetical protein